MARVLKTLISLKNYGKVYACNAVYRHFHPLSVAVDVKMILEITQCKWQMENEVWTNPNKQFNAMQGFKFFPISKGWSRAQLLYGLQAHTVYYTIYILGFDFGNPDTNGQRTKVNNLYVRTHNYKKKGEPATYFGNWERQLQVHEAHAGTRYIRIVEDDDDFVSKVEESFNLSTTGVNLEDIMIFNNR